MEETIANKICNFKAEKEAEVTEVVKVPYSIVHIFGR